MTTKPDPIDTAHAIVRYCTAVGGLFALCLLVSACSGGDSPSQSWEHAIQGIYGAELSDDGSLAIIGSITHGGSLWNVPGNERKFNWNHQQGQFSNIIYADFSPDRGFAITAERQTMVLWNASTGQGISFWTAPSEILDIELSTTGNFALLGLEDHSAALFDVRRGGVKRVFYHEDRVRSVSLNSQQNLVLSGSEDHTAKLWNLQDGKQLFNWQHEDEVQLVKLSPNADRALTAAKYDKAVVWDTKSGDKIGELPLRGSAVARGLIITSAAFSSDGKLLLTGNSNRTVQLWQIDGFKELKRWQLPKRYPWKPASASVVALSFSPQNNRFFAIASNGFTHQLER